MKNIGERIKQLRSEKGLTQQELADRLNVTRQAVSSWERNRTEPDMDMFNHLCQLFGVSLDQLGGKSLGPNQNQSPLIMIVTTILLIGGFVSSFWFEFRLSTYLFSLIIWICGLVTHFSLNHAIKNRDFTNIAGYDKDIEMNLDVFSRIIKNIMTHISWASLITVILLYALNILIPDSEIINLILLMAYILDMVIYIYFINYKSKEDLYLKESDQMKSDLSGKIVLIFTGFICLSIFALSQGKGTGSNQISFSGFLVITGMILSTVGLIREELQLKSNTPDGYGISRAFKILYSISTVLIVLALVIY